MTPARPPQSASPRMAAPDASNPGGPARRTPFRNVRSAVVLWLAALVWWVLLLAHAAQQIDLAPLRALDRYLYDARLALFSPDQQDPRIVIIDIDERALAAHGRWPWRRGLLAELLESTFQDYGALVVGLDLILAEADKSSGLPTLERLAAGPLQGNTAFAQQLAALRPSLDEDGHLAQVLQRHPVVLGFYFSDGDGSAQTATLPPPSLAASSPGLKDLPDWQGHGGNLDRLQSAAGQAGFLNAVADEDGITRRSLLLARQGSAVFASLPLALAQTLLNAPKLQSVESPAGNLLGLRLQTPRGPLQLNTDDSAGALIPYRAAEGDYAHFSAADLLDKKLPRQALHGRVVLLGSSAPGLLDQRATPLHPSYPGVGVHASMLTGILDGTLAHTPSNTAWIELGLLLLTGLPLMVLAPHLSTWRNAGLLLSLLIGLLSLNLWAWRGLHEAWPLASPLALLAGMAGLLLLIANVGARSARRQLTRLFGHYLPPTLVEEMSHRPDHYSMASRSAVLSVMFADVKGFTGISEHLNPTALAELMNEYFTAMAGIIGQHRGTLDKFMGDAVMAFWGAPLADELHARHAVEAALAMHASMTELNRRFAARGWPTLRISIGINTGPMVVGDLGSRQRRAYTVLGDSVNLAARLQSLCAERGAEILIGEATQAAMAASTADLPPICSSVSLGQQAVRGRAASVEVFELKPAQFRN
ncbi:CHASE2 domain-containing protein [Roseateles koreensis]|uniref:CHASE2 domain-containing protein n=1 Tax=Roseateles koreensis TaxID=2987526 RepID=UPI00235A3D40|nr:adenylate/guanylate cyclase domain-containing protein [Roseateles koreensis]